MAAEKRQTKIVGTLGPASASEEMVGALIDAGLDVVRLNFSHGDHESHEQLHGIVRRQAAKRGKPVAILADLAGPKIRLGDLPNGGVEVRRGDVIVLSPNPANGDVLPVNFADFASVLIPGSRFFVDDGNFEFVVLDLQGDHVRCEVQTSGLLKSRKGVNLPHVGLSVPALTPKDLVDLEFAKRLGVDYVAISFVRRAEDVLEAKRVAGMLPVIAKIEKPGAIESLDAIAQVADGVMVARGDLGIEVGFEKVPVLQKRIIRTMNRLGKPVITATQMLESMVTNARPTRAEVSDIANAALDGTDAVMLSAETASGKYPVESVRVMASVLRHVESEALARGVLAAEARVDGLSFDNAIAHSTARAAIELNLKAVAVYTESGRTVALVSAFRPGTPIVGIAGDEAVVRRMTLLWGVQPVRSDWIQTHNYVELAEQELLARQLVKPGDEIAVTVGHAVTPSFRNSSMKLWKVRGGEA